MMTIITKLLPMQLSIQIKQYRVILAVRNSDRSRLIDSDDEKCVSFAAIFINRRHVNASAVKRLISQKKKTNDEKNNWR